ncbi:Zinc finger MYM-type protein, partial [Corchorus olitorius]
MSKRKLTIDSFFKKKVNDSQTTESSDVLAPNIEQSPPDEQPPAISPNSVQGSSNNPSTTFSNEQEKNDTSSFVRDPGLRPPIWDYPINQRDEFQRKYVNAGPYTHMLANYPYSGE